MRQGALETIERGTASFGERYNPNKKTEEFRNCKDTAPGVLERNANTPA